MISFTGVRRDKALNPADLSLQRLRIEVGTVAENTAGVNTEAFDQFRANVHGWAEAMLHQARELGIVSRKFARWNRAGSGVYMYELRSEPALHDDAYLSAFHVPEWEPLLQASIGLAPWTPSGMVGTAAQKFSFDLRDFSIRTLDDALTVRNGEIVLIDEALENRLSALRSLIVDPTLSAELVILLDHCEAPATIRLDEFSELERLSDERLDGIVPMLIVPADVDSTKQLRVNIEWHGRCALRHVLWFPKSTDYQVTETPPSNEQLLDRLVDQLQDCLALTSLRQANVLGWFTRFNNPLLAGAVGWSRTGMRTADADEQTAKVLDSVEVRRLWQQLPKVASQKTDSLKLALRRMRYAAQRASLEDRLIDLAIAAEALFLGGVEDELAFRFSLHASLWLSGTSDLATADTFNIFKKAYGARSGVVHGKRLRDDKTYEIGGDQMSTTKLVDEFHRLTVQSVKKALDVSENATYAPKWEEMLHARLSAPAGDENSKGDG
jgi:hypothetical protein